LSVAPSGFIPGVSPWEQSSNILTLGNVQFLDEEHPDEIEFELEQSMAVHQLIGGSRTIQPLGPNPKDVTWTGHLWADNVKPRLADLKAMEVAALPVQLTYLDQSYMVVVKSFRPKYFHQFYASYTITVTVQSDTSGQYQNTAPPSTGQQVNGVTAAAQAEINAIVAEDSVGTAAILATFNALFAALEAAGLAGLY
jgi:hypothetical protein